MTTPTTASLSDDIVSKVAVKIAQDIPLLPKAFVRVLAKALAGALAILYRYCGFVALQLFVSSASSEETTINGRKIRPLVEWGRLVGAGDPNAATRAELVLTVTVTNQTGTLDDGAQLLYATTGVLYVTTAAVALNASTVAVTVRAASGQNGADGSGVIGNLAVAAVLQFANPLPNVATNAVVASVKTTAADAETWDAYRARVVRRFQQKPQGGAYADYRAWAEDVDGVLNAYPYASTSPGNIDVYVEAVATLASPDGIPTTDQKTAVATAIALDDAGLASRRPVNAGVNVLAITRKSFNVTITGLSDVTAEAAISQAIDDYLRSREPFIVGLSTLPALNRITQGAVAGVVDDVVSSVGATVTTVTLYDGVTAIPAFTLGNGQKAKLGTATYA